MVREDIVSGSEKGCVKGYERVFQWHAWYVSSREMCVVLLYGRMVCFVLAHLIVPYQWPYDLIYQPS